MSSFFTRTKKPNTNYKKLLNELTKIKNASITETNNDLSTKNEEILGSKLNIDSTYFTSLTDESLINDSIKIFKKYQLLMEKDKKLKEINNKKKESKFFTKKPSTEPSNENKETELINFKVKEIRYTYIVIR